MVFMNCAKNAYLKRGAESFTIQKMIHKLLRLPQQ